MAKEQASVEALEAPGLRVALVHGIVEHHDAISASVYDMAQLLGEMGHEVTTFCYKSDYPDLRAVQVGGINDLILHDKFMAADLIIWHFGIYYELFNASLIGNGRARQVVCFHNITPLEFAPSFAAATIERSLQQALLLAQVDEIWAVSDLNARTALEYGCAPEKIHTISLQVDWPPHASLTDKSEDQIELLYVGRFTKAKGVLDLLDAVRRIPREALPPFRLRLAGNVAFSDSSYVEEIKFYINDHGLDKVVEFIGTVTGEQLASFYEDAHILCIASYHEGFCKPVIEGLRSGCVPIVYRAYNLPLIVNGLGKVVDAGDVDALSAAMIALIGQVETSFRNSSEAALELDGGRFSQKDFGAAALAYSNQFSRQSIALRIAERLTAMFSHEEASHDK